MLDDCTRLLRTALVVAAPFPKTSETLNLGRQSADETLSESKDRWLVERHKKGRNETGKMLKEIGAGDTKFSTLWALRRAVLLTFLCRDSRVNS